MSKEFKVGDKVYFPLQGTQIFTLSECNKYGGCPLSIHIGCYIYGFNNKGQGLLDQLPMLHHATPENHALLEQLYGVEFEKPPTSREIIKALFGKGYDNIPCWVSEDFEPPTHDDKWVFIAYCDDTTHSEFPYTDSAGYDWKYATPFDPRTGEPITELPT